MVFLSGETRAFADLAPVSDTSIGFHGSYRQDGTLAAEQRLRMLTGLVARETGGKADPELVQRRLHFPTQRDMIRFTYPGSAGTQHGPTVFECHGDQRSPTDYAPCTAIADHDALTMGIITTTDVLHGGR